MLTVPDVADSEVTNTFGNNLTKKETLKSIHSNFKLSPSLHMVPKWPPSFKRVTRKTLSNTFKRDLDPRELFGLGTTLC